MTSQWPLESRCRVSRCHELVTQVVTLCRWWPPLTCWWRVSPSPRYSTVQYSTAQHPLPPGVVQPGLAPARPHLLHRQRPPAPPAPRRPRGGDQARVCLASCIVFRKRSSPPSKWQMKSLSPSLSKPNRFCGQDIAFRLHIHNRAANDPSAKLYNHGEALLGN